LTTHGEKIFCKHLSFEKVVPLYINIETLSSNENRNAFFSECELDRPESDIASA